MNTSSADNSKYIWTHDNEKIYPADIKKKLEELGLKKGDVLMGHFDLKTFGKIGNIKKSDEFYNAIISTIISVIGDDGALIIPTYTYSFCNNQIFDVKNTKPNLGGFAEFAFKKYKENLEFNLGLHIIRSNDPIFSCVGFGNKSQLILKNLNQICFGDDSVFGRLYKYDAKLIGFGFQFAVTYMHFVERRYNDLKESLKYRFNKAFKGRIIEENTEVHDAEYIYFVRDLQCEYDFPKVPKELERQSLLNKVNIGAGVITVANAKDIYATIFKMLDSDKFSLLRKLT